MRCAARVGVCVLFGVVMTTALAWWPIILNKTSWTYTEYLQGFDEPRNLRWHEHPSRWASEGRAWRSTRDELPESISGLREERAPGWFILPRADGPESGEANETSTLAYGYPFRSLRAGTLMWRQSSTRPNQATGSVGWWSAFRMPNRVGGQMLRLPARIWWPGFVADTMIGSAMAMAVVFGVPQARRRIRARRNACLACGYLLHGLSTRSCPECGWCEEVSGSRWA